ncbi:MAG: hypothetical protein NTX50_30775 [Candidatus Sumerlaeota bacterium]|nr:hypothetical protein [Candidatus Sumerlaeota bacterium]
MIQYIIKLANKVLELSKFQDFHPELYRLVPVLAEELNRLDPRDFLPDAQYDFIDTRARIRMRAKELEIESDKHSSVRKSGFSLTDARAIGANSQKMIEILGKYGGEGGHICLRSFNFVKDSDLKQIIERDYRELRLKVFPSGAWKSSVILAGSILEAILYDQLATDPAIQAKAVASKEAPTHKSGKVKDLVAGEWVLFELIKVAVDLTIIPLERSKSIDQVLRDYRNFVHPKKEIKANHPCAEAEAMMSIGALDGICNVLK